MIKRIIRKIERIIWNKKRVRINEKNRQRLNDKAKNTSIISMNYVGGILSRDLGLRFLSPTINLYMTAPDYIKFCENLKYYFSIDEFTDKGLSSEGYPIAKLDDITLYLVHYQSVIQAQDKWNERKKRVDFNNIAILCCEREGMNEELKDRFEALPYKKVMFTHLKDEKHKSTFYIKGYENDACVGLITVNEGAKGLRPIDQFDYVEFLNN